MLKRRQNFLIMTSTWNLFFFALLFREFFYIQMEKYARQALSEGVKSDTELHVSEESELYRVLNVHYNRNNHIEVSSSLFSFHKIRRRTLYKLSYMTMRRGFHISSGRIFAYFIITRWCQLTTQTRFSDYALPTKFCKKKV